MTDESKTITEVPAEEVPADETPVVEEYSEPEFVPSGRSISDGGNVRINTGVPAHADNEGTNISFVHSSGETRQLSLADYVKAEGRGEL